MAFLSGHSLSSTFLLWFFFCSTLRRYLHQSFLAKANTVLGSGSWVPGPVSCALSSVSWVPVPFGFGSRLQWIRQRIRHRRQSTSSYPFRVNKWISRVGPLRLERISTHWNSNGLTKIQKKVDGKFKKNKKDPVIMYPVTLNLRRYFLSSYQS